MVVWIATWTRPGALLEAHQLFRRTRYKWMAEPASVPGTDVHRSITKIRLRAFSAMDGSGPSVKRERGGRPLAYGCLANLGLVLVGGVIGLVHLAIVLWCLVSDCRSSSLFFACKL